MPRNLAAGAEETTTLTTITTITGIVVAPTVSLTVPTHQANLAVEAVAVMLTQHMEITLRCLHKASLRADAAITRPHRPKPKATAAGITIIIGGTITTRQMHIMAPGRMMLQCCRLPHITCETTTTPEGVATEEVIIIGTQTPTHPNHNTVVADGTMAMERMIQEVVEVIIMPGAIRMGTRPPTTKALTLVDRP